VELDNLGYDISIALALTAEEVRKAVALFQPDLIISPFLKERIPRTSITTIRASFFIRA
jgi:putative two-component system hydrogenase maturation factor HypX/HoxX